ncbi:allophanate hydrolase subunit 2 [Medicago truncatula]|uniref:Allophanate hydrolase subunit 2 n=2 Tax=cellular organisms TaxID=131567 RepID=A0A072TCT1_MEDTR|nr:allophanate hydrolase subunit 2 [Medicago truncatula]
MDDLALSLANVMVGNATGAAGIEIQTFPLRVRAQTEHRVAVTGAACTLKHRGHALPACWSIRLRSGEELTIERPTSGARAYLAVAGGIDVETVMGSRSTDFKHGFGGYQGRALRAGDLLPVGATADVRRADDFGIVPPEVALSFTQTTDVDSLPVRVIAGPEHDEFDPASQHALWTSGWTVTTMSDRMGSRLSGATLTLAEPREMRSVGIIPGVVQVPPSGDPLIQLRDSNAAGGYPRIGVVIRADLWRIAQARPGATLRFHRVTRQQAVMADRKNRDFIERVGRDVARYADMDAAATARG